jgi:hypothetical protein
MRDEVIDERHLYSALRLRVYMYESDGSNSNTVGSGTGFVMESTLGIRGTGQRGGYLVTNQHVLDPNFTKFTGRRVDRVEASGFVQAADTWEGRPTLLGNARPVKFTIESPQPQFADGGSDADIAIIDLETAGIPDGRPILNELSNFNVANIDDFNSRLHVGAQVLIPGYPSIDGVAAERPILVSGTIASDPREAAEIGPIKFEKNVLCHSFSWGGMSGSPVFAFVQKRSLTWGDVEHGNSRELYLVGVNRGHFRVGGTNEGALTYFVKSSVLAKLLRDMGHEGLWRNIDDE